MFPGNHPEPHLGLRLLCKAGEEENGVFLSWGRGKQLLNIIIYNLCIGAKVVPQES